MLMADDKKNTATLIMKKMMGDKPVTEEAPTKDGVEQDDSVAVETAAEELISAIEMKSTKGIVEAIKSLIELIQEGPSVPESVEPK